MDAAPDPTSTPSVDENRLLDDLVDLLTIPSVSGSAAEPEAQAWLAERWRTEGFDVDQWDIDVAAIEADPEFPGMEVERTHAVGVTATLHGTGGGATLLLDGHTDVVPPGDLDAWSGPGIVNTGKSATLADARRGARSVGGASRIVTRRPLPSAARSGD